MTKDEAVGNKGRASWDTRRLGTKDEAVGTLMMTRTRQLGTKDEAAGTLRGALCLFIYSSDTIANSRRKQVTQIPTPRENYLLSDSGRCELLLESGPLSPKYSMLESPL